MSNVSHDRLQDVIEFYNENGEDETLQAYNIKGSSLRRYLRKYHHNDSPKIFLFDIETAPMRAYVWGLWKQNIEPNTQLSNDWFCLSWAGKWLFDHKIYSQRLTGDEALDEDDTRIIHGIWGKLNEADIVIAHNGWKFDIPRLNTRFIVNGLLPPLPYEVIDTLKVAKRSFAFSSNKLDMLNKSLGLERKQETGTSENGEIQ